jgi:murein DD-endopeptidase MepM/ murein hydrolase activator NlpD
MYVAPDLRVGDRVTAGDIIGRQQDLALHPAYRNVPTHLHFELWSGERRSSGNIISIEGLF